MRRLSSPVFIGRVAELAELGDAAGRAATGQPSTVLVAGEAGVGKTRLMAEFARVTEANGGVVLRGGCIDLGHGVVPYAPVVEALRPLARDLDPTRPSPGGGREREDLAALLRQLTPADTHAELRDPGQGRLFETLLRVLARRADEQPTVLLVEDLQWADTSTRDLFGFLARNLRRERLLLIGTYRSDDLHRGHPLRPFLAELDRLGVHRIELPRFSREEVGAQLAAIAGGPRDVDFVQRVFARSEGNAFFTEELAAANAGAQTNVLPQTLRDILDARVERLSDRSRSVLRVIAVAGRSVDESLLAAVTGLSDHEVTEALREALAHQVLVIADVEVETYAFRHALLREAVYADLLAGERKRLHRALAEALQARDDVVAVGGAGSRAERAHHWYAARQFREALVESVAAGAVAEQAYAFPEALEHYERALDLWDEVDDAATLAGIDRVELARRAGVAAHRSDDHRRAVALLRSALSEVDETTDPARAGELHALLIGPLAVLGDGESAARSIADGFRLVPADPPTEMRSLLLRGHARSLLYEDRYVEARAAAEEALALAREIRSLDAADDAAEVLVVASVFAGDVDAALTSATEQLREAERDHDANAVARGWNAVGFVLQAALRFDEAADAYLAGAAAAPEIGIERPWRDDLEWAAAEAMRRGGRWQEADDLSRGLLERAGFGSVQAHELRALLLPAMGRLDEAEGHAEAVWKAAEGDPAVGTNRSYYPARADIAIWRGQLAAARGAIADGLRMFEASDDLRWIGELVVRGLRIEADLAEIARAEQSGQRCADAQKRGKAILRRMFAVARRARETESIFVRESDAPLLLARAEWSRLLGRSEPERWSAVARAWRAIGQPYQAAYARYREAEALLHRRARREDVTTALRDARDTATGLGAVPLLRDIEALAHRARVRLEATDADRATRQQPPVPPDALAAYGLTSREREVLELVAAGHSDRQIADALFISHKTASVHVSNIKGKLGVATRVEAATLALRLGSQETMTTGSQPRERGR